MIGPVSCIGDVAQADGWALGASAPDGGGPMDELILILSVPEPEGEDVVSVCARMKEPEARAMINKLTLWTERVWG